MIRRFREWLVTPASPRFIWTCITITILGVILVIIAGLLSGCEPRRTPTTWPTQSPQGPIERTPVRD